jgi:FAD/FMN-containing dehydrogenase
MNRMDPVDVLGNTVRVQAGAVTEAVHQHCAQHGLTWPVDFASKGSSHVGGNIATNAGGVKVIRYGLTRQWVLGLQVVTAKGQVLELNGALEKNNTGADLRQLFIGSEGTLGIITAATLKLHPQPAARCTALAACASVQACVDLLALARHRLGPGLTGFEVMNAFSLALVAKHFPALPRPLGPAPWTVLLELSDAEGEAHARALFEGLLEAALEAGTIADAAVAASLQQSQQLWHLRESIPLAQAEEGLNIKHDIALPVSAIPAFVSGTDAALGRAVPGVRLVDFGHLGDGNLHYNVQAPEGTAAADFLADQEKTVNAIVHDAVQAHGGSISAEHGIGALKRDELARRKPPVALALMRAIKQALDPQGLMNPGRLL